MRYFLICFSIIILLFGCASVPKEYLDNDNICHYDDLIFNISKEELTIDLDLLEQLKQSKKDTILVDNKLFKNEFWYSKNEITNKQTKKETNINKYLYYNNDGRIELSCFTYNNIYLLAKETHYDEQGNITEVIDYEKGYNICWAEAIEIVKRVAKKEIEKYEVTGFNLSFRVDLNKFPNEKPEWGITLIGNEEYELKPVTVYWIDGITGKFLRTTKITTSYD